MAGSAAPTGSPIRLGARLQGKSLSPIPDNSKPKTQTSLDVRVVFRGHVGLFTGINRSGDLLLLLLHKILALLDILGPLGASAIVVLLAAIHILTYLLLALFSIGGRALPGLLRQS